MTPELRLLFACARVRAHDDEAAIRQMLDEGIEWTLFARKALDHGLAGLAGHVLARVAPDTVPQDILDALRTIIAQTGERNRALFDELAAAIEALAKDGVEALALKTPIIAIQAYDDIGLRACRHLDFLVRDSDIAATIATLRGLGYERQGRLTAVQFDLIHRLRGREIVFKQASGTAAELYTRLTPIETALDIDYAGLWRRAQLTNLNGRTMLTLAPEDELIVLAIHGGIEMWRSIKWACDAAGFIGSHPKLDWSAIVERARAQGCLRMVLLATSLAHKVLSATVPAAITAAEGADPTIEAMAGRIVAHWQADEPAARSNKTLSMDRLRLHDGVVRRARHVTRTLLWPAPRHVALMPLPKGLSFGYVPIKIAHDTLALPLWRAQRTLRELTGRWRDVLKGSGLALASSPANVETRLGQMEHQKLRAAANRALAADPNNFMAWCKLADALFGLKRYNEAITCYDKALAIEPDNLTIWMNRRAVTQEAGKRMDLPDVTRNPNADAWAVRSGALWSSKRYAQSVEACDRALSLDPGHVGATRMGIHSRLNSCDWRRREDDKRRVTVGLKAGTFVIRTVDHRGLCDSEEELRLSAQQTARDIRPSATPLWSGERYRHDKIRIAYLSTDFRVHAVASLIVGCFERHDKTRFETTAVSLTASDASETRRRIESAFDRFIDAQDIKNIPVAKMLRELEIDIAVDLNGYSGEMRSGILAHRPAPVQVNYLGYPGTTALPFIDYIIADHIVIPEEHQVHYSEKVVYLPHAYLPNDRCRRIAQHMPSRTDAGLPEAGFVFACHNTTYKIGPEVFDVWMRLLQTVEGSVLWLQSTNIAAMSNLRREANARGIAPDRLVFAPWVSHEEDHLARLRLADLFLDTLPFNAHSTACDALWAGVPVVTCPGNAFPARVAASLLRAIGLPELVTASLAEYETLARTLAQNPERLAAVKAKLMRNRDTEPLFDTARFTRYLESAYTTMWKRQQAGLPPESFAVES